MNPVDLIVPDWAVSDSIVACCTTRNGGVSQDGYTSLNLADHVADDPFRVVQNRALLRQALNLPSEPEWLNQTHSVDVAHLDRSNTRDADAAITVQPGKVVVVMTADCLPVLFCNQAGTEVGAAHAGWRGLLNGVLEKTVEAMSSNASQIHAWLGPAIGPDHFEVGPEVYRAFTEQDPAMSAYFIPSNKDGHYLADLYSIARARLKKIGLVHISGGEHCTFGDAERFFSFRREKVTGRQASLIYIKNNPG